MIASPLSLLFYVVVIDALHFNGGTIRWEPRDPYDNSSSVQIAIIQSYSWTYPIVTCATNVPISTIGRSYPNANLTCVTYCSTDGGYSNAPVNILTDCVSVSASLTVLTSRRSVNITLSAGAYFNVAYQGSAWLALNSPSQSGLYWSILCSIDLRMRADGFINTPPEANVASPQYAIVNEPTQIEIPVSDANAGDDVRCRWSTYTPGYRKRRQSDEDFHHPSAVNTYQKATVNGEAVLIRRKRRPCSAPACTSRCAIDCLCSCPTCIGTTCSGSTCLSGTCQNISATTTLETPGTIPSTISYPTQNAIDECGGICYPANVPSGATLSNCTLSFVGLVPDTWYAIAIQVEDFINDTSVTPMSSVPVQFLIYVMPQPTCSSAPVIIPLKICLEVTVNVSKSFNIFAMNSCDPNITEITDIIVSNGITNMEVSNLTTWPANASLVYVTFTWTPEESQIGSQQLCTIAYTSDRVQSAQYCVTFDVTTSYAVCTTTTTTTTSTATTSTTTSTTTSSTTTTTSSTTSTTTTTTSATSTTTTTTTTSTTTTTATTSTTTTTTTTSTTTTTTTTSTTTTTTTTSTTTTTITTSTSTTASSTTSTTTSASIISTTQLTDNLSLGLGLGLGLPLLLLLSALSICLCCRWCPGRFWSSLRQRFWGEDEVFCQLCRRRCVYHEHMNNRKMSEEASGQYRQQYISNNPSTPTRPSFRDDSFSPFDMDRMTTTRTALMSPSTPTRPLFHDDSFLSGSFSPFDMGSMTTTRTTLMSSLSNSVLPSEDVPMQMTHPVRPQYPSSGGSILVRAYVEQEATGDTAFGYN